MTSFARLGTTEQIVVPDDRFAAPIMRFRDIGPLAACTTAGYDGGCHIIRADRSTALFSSGELALWSLLRSLTSGDLREMLEGADGLTTAALSDLFARVTWAGRVTS